jgi:hypothetical protein
LRSCCFANILIIPKQLPSENTDAHYLRLTSFSDNATVTFDSNLPASMDTIVRSSFEGLTRLYGHAIKTVCAKGCLGTVYLFLKAARRKRKSDAAKLSTPISCLAVEACSEPRPWECRRRKKASGNLRLPGKRH